MKNVSTFGKERICRKTRNGRQRGQAVKRLWTSHPEAGAWQWAGRRPGLGAVGRPAAGRRPGPETEPGRGPGPETGPAVAQFSGWGAMIVSRAAIVLHAGVLLNIFCGANISTTPGVKCALARAGLVKRPPAVS